MSKPAENQPDNPAELRAMIAALQTENARIEAENAKMLATLRVHDQLVQALRLRIAKLQKMAFGKSSERIEREIPSRAIGFAMPCRAAEQLELALEDLLVAVAEEDDAPIDEGHDEPAIDEPSAPALRHRPRVSDATPRERRELGIRRAGAGACTTPLVQARQAYFGRRVTITRNCAGTMSRRSDASSPITWALITDLGHERDGADQCHTPQGLKRVHRRGEIPLRHQCFNMSGYR